ncbi:MAG: hypothetical protein HUJ80_06560, partial [Firmicutes bacterium]|nr:hypothetical protein [Bacillota bacterium]
GTSREYGAREIDRVISAQIKPLLADELLFGALKKGGSCRLTAQDGAFKTEFTAGTVGRGRRKKA